MSSPLLTSLPPWVSGPFPRTDSPCGGHRTPGVGLVHLHFPGGPASEAAGCAPARPLWGSCRPWTSMPLEHEGTMGRNHPTRGLSAHRCQSPLPRALASTAAIHTRSRTFVGSTEGRDLRVIGSQKEPGGLQGWLSPLLHGLVLAPGSAEQCSAL